MKGESKNQKCGQPFRMCYCSVGNRGDLQQMKRGDIPFVREGSQTIHENNTSQALKAASQTCLMEQTVRHSENGE